MNTAGEQDGSLLDVRWKRPISRVIPGFRNAAANMNLKGRKPAPCPRHRMGESLRTVRSLLAIFPLRGAASLQEDRVGSRLAAYK